TPIRGCASLVAAPARGRRRRRTPCTSGCCSWAPCPGLGRSGRGGAPRGRSGPPSRGRVLDGRVQAGRVLDEGKESVVRGAAAGAPIRHSIRADRLPPSHAPWSNDDLGCLCRSFVGL